MQPEGNAQNENVDPAAAPVTAPEPVKKDNLFENTPKKSGKGMIFGLVLCAILAVGGIGFGVWAMMDGNAQMAKKDEQIVNLRNQLAEKNQVVVEDDTTVDVEIGEGNDIERKFGFRAVYADGIRDEESMVVCAPGFANSCLLLSLNGTVVVDFFRTNWEQLESNMAQHKRDREDITDKIDGRVVDVAIGHVGDGALDVMLFLLDDGRVLYTNESDLLLQNYDMKLIDGANGVIRLYGNMNNIDCAGFIQDSKGAIKRIMVDRVDQNTGEVVLKV